MRNEKECDLKNRLEMLVGHEIELNPQLVVPISTHTIQSGKLTFRKVDVVVTQELDAVGKPSDVCTENEIIDVSGTGKTLNDGKIELKLSSFLCSEDFPLLFESPAIVVVTARAQSPILVTARASVTANKGDVKIEVETWGMDGAAAPRQSFNWMCRVPLPVYIIGKDTEVGS
jgi:hypothetical protein